MAWGVHARRRDRTIPLRRRVEENYSTSKAYKCACRGAIIKKFGIAASAYIRNLST